MKIVFTGGGSGGHFYPIIAVAEEINKIAKEQKLLTPQLYYIAPEKYDARALYENNIIFKKSPAGKVRRYFSFWNLIDKFKTAIGVIKATLQLFAIYPDVVFSKGGYASFPTVFAARILRIPIVIHESDAVPGRVNKWSSKFATKIAVSYPEAVSSFEKDIPDDEAGKIAFTGNPVRKELYTLAKEGAHEYLKLEKNIPTILVLGGSQGAKKINDTLMEALPKLVEKYQIIHQTGRKNFEDVKSTTRIILEGTEYGHRYKVFDFLNTLAMRMSGGASDIVISRAGSGAIAEIALWGLPSIIVPISQNVSHDQHKNAYAYARSGGAVVIEEKNFTPNLLISEIERLLGDNTLTKTMREGAKEFAKPDAARKIAEGIITTALKHEE